MHFANPELQLLIKFSFSSLEFIFSNQLKQINYERKVNPICIELTSLSFHFSAGEYVLHITRMKSEWLIVKSRQKWFIRNSFVWNKLSIFVRKQVVNIIDQFPRFSHGKRTEANDLSINTFLQLFWLIFNTIGLLNKTRTMVCLFWCGFS